MASLLDQIQLASLLPHSNTCATNAVVSLYTGGQILKERLRMTYNLIGEKERVDLFIENFCRFYHIWTQNSTNIMVLDISDDCVKKCPCEREDRSFVL